MALADDHKSFQKAGLALTLPFTLLSGPLVGFFIGDWLDGQFGTAPWLLVLFLVFGFVASAKETIRVIRRLSKP